MQSLVIAALLLVLLLATIGWCEESPQWVQVTPEATFTPRDTAEDAVFLDKMWISNAYHAGGTLVRDLWNTSDGVTWTKVLDETPYDGYSEMVVYKDKLWAIKGSVWNTDDGVNWTQVLEKTPFGVRGYGECVVFQDKIWQLGSGSDVWNTSDGVNWTKVVDQAPFGNRWASAVMVYDNKLWLCGGRIKQTSEPPEKHYPDFTTFNDVWSSPDGVNWTLVSENAPWAHRMWFVGREYAGKMFIIGGFSNRESKNFEDTWYTTDGVNWTEIKSDNGWSPRHEPTIYVFQGSLWLAAGNSWPLMNDVWKLTFPAAEEQ
jgi:hypothetical protein